MNKEELIGKLQMVYVGDKNALNELISYYDGLKQGIEELQQENKQLKEQQKEFINYLENGIDICDGFLDTVKSDSQEIPYGVISASKTYITTRIKENETAHKVYEEILQKYKEMIGGKDV